MFKPVKEIVHERIMRKLQNLILPKYQPGDKLPGERVLANILGVSRASLREALKALEASEIEYA